MSYQSCDRIWPWLCAPELSQALHLSTLISAALSGGWYYPALGTFHTVALLFAHCSPLHQEDLYPILIPRLSFHTSLAEKGTLYS